MFVYLDFGTKLAQKYTCNTKMNLLVKPDEQKKACFHFAMARKGARKRTDKNCFHDKNKLQFIGLTRMNINEKINEIINVQLMIINVQNNARSAPKLKH